MFDFLTNDSPNVYLVQNEVNIRVLPNVVYLEITKHDSIQVIIIILI